MLMFKTGLLGKRDFFWGLLGKTLLPQVNSMVSLWCPSASRSQRRAGSLGTAPTVPRTVGVTAGIVPTLIFPVIVDFLYEFAFFVVNSSFTHVVFPFL